MSKKKVVPLYKQMIAANAKRHHAIHLAAEKADLASPRIMDALIARADGGSEKAMESILDRSLGKATQRIEADVDVSPIEIVLEWAK